ncbi:hypothetical protein HPP92_024820 [Vanilla planifolia]|uniref:Uncharacterized protein n=1 Tax=Vanilla planifolia TaxID=51239 RepID=A0A835PGQ7_VANPL|nr:hypothetical protein HPP92_024820 [Vanilla planifolia]
MPRYNPSAEGFNVGGRKFRKRGFSSSSTTSLPYSSQAKRSVLIRKRNRHTKPVATSKMSMGSPCSSGRICEAQRHQISILGGRGCGTQAPVSARKLANALWEMNSNPPPPKHEKLQGKFTKKEKSSSELLRSFEAISLPKHLYDPSHSPISVSSEESRSNSNRRMISMIPKNSQQAGHDRASKFARCGSPMETQFSSQSFIALSSTMKDRLKDLLNGLSTCKELLKVQHRFCGCAEQHSLGFTIFSAVSSELKQAILNINQLICEQKSVCNGINYVKDNLAAELRAWKNKEQERMSSAVHSFIKDLDSERKLRRSIERLNKKLRMDLAETRASLLNASNDLVRERMSREKVERFYNELARGIGEDRAEVEELKRESAKAREDLEKERKMLHLADEWREERIQMKLSEAKLQFEEKNAVIDRLRNELEAFLSTERGNGDGNSCENASRELGIGVSSQLFCPSKADNRVENEEKLNGDLSEDCDLHSIELNMDSKSRSFNWSYATGSADYCTSSEENNFISEMSKKESWANGEGKEVCSRRSSQLTCNDWQQGKLSGNNINLNEDAERYISVKELRDQLLAGSRTVLPQGSLTSPGEPCGTSCNHQWSRLQDFQDSDRLKEGLKVAELIKQLEGADPR